MTSVSTMSPHKNMTNKRALAQNTVIQIGGKMLAILCGLYTVTILTKLLGPAGFGELTVVLNFIAIFAVLVDFGLTLTTVQLISEKQADENALIGNLFSIRVLSSVLFLSIAPIIAIFFPYTQLVKLAIAVGAVSYLFGTTAQLFIGIFQKRLLISRAIIAELINRLLVLFGALLLPYFHVGVMEVMWLFVLGNIGQLLTIVFFASKHITISFRFNWATWKKILLRSWPIGASIFFNLIYLRGDILFLSLFRSSEEIGIYGVAYKIIDVMTVIPVMYMGLILPVLVHAWSEQNKKQFYATLQTAFDFFSLIAIPFIFGVIATGVPLMTFIFGEEFSEAGRVLAILGPAASVVFFGSLFGHAVVGINKQKQMVVGYALVAVITIIGYLLFIPQFGIWAAAWWTLIAEVLITLITFAVVFHVSKFKPSLQLTGKSLIASALMFGGMYLLPHVHVLLSIMIGCIIYYVIMHLLGGPKLSEAAKLFLPEKPPITQP